MDDYSINSLTESKNEWSARLVSILTSSITQGINSIFDESNKLCLENDEENNKGQFSDRDSDYIPEKNTPLNVN